MPKRTDDFQELVSQIYQCIVRDGGKVEQSALVLEPSSGALREVDILITQKIAGHEIKIMVECRNRSRKESLEWIDSLIGKLSSLGVGKIVAVSSSGFTEPALKKAAAHDIDALTLKQACDADWASYGLKPGFALWTDESLAVYDVRYLCDGDFVSLSGVAREADVLFNGKRIFSLQEFVNDAFAKHVAPYIQKGEENRKIIASQFQTRSDLDKTIYLEAVQTFPNLELDLISHRIDLSKLKFFMTSTRSVVDVPVEHFKLNLAMASKGSYVDVDGSRVEVGVVQVEGESKASGYFKKVPQSHSKKK